MGGLTTKLLVIDDDAEIRRTLSDYLEDSGHTVIQAPNGRIGLELFSRHSPDVVLLDLRMPGIDGFHVLEKLAVIDPEVPVIVISGQSTMGDAIDALRLGAWDYLTKPIHDLALLSHTLDRVLERVSLAARYRESQDALREFMYLHIDKFDGVLANINVRQQTNYRHLEKELYDNWGLGKYIILSWCRRQAGLEILVVPHDFVATFHAGYSKTQAAAKMSADDPSLSAQSSRELMRGLIGGSRQLSAERLSRVARSFAVEPVKIDVPYHLQEVSLDPRIVDEMVKRYSISFESSRAVFLVDIVGFSLYRPLVQMTQLNSLAYSLNLAQSKMVGKKLDVSFARSTTGDGFYVWNRANGPQANENLYLLMSLMLAENAIARQISTMDTAPRLKTAFHVGDYYDLYQTEGLHPSIYNYVVGDATIELARMQEKALPEQIIVGDFRIPRSDTDDTSLGDTTTPEFIERLQGSIENLRGLALPKETIFTIKSYLTGKRKKDGGFDIRKYRITDKHGLSRNIFNAKFNIHRKDAQPIYLGIAEKDLVFPKSAEKN